VPKDVIVASPNQRKDIMAEATKAAKPLDFTKSLEMPAGFRDFAEKSAAQTKEMFDRMKIGAEEATDLLESTFKTAATGAVEYNRKLIEKAR
jgi:hypothetical protein